MMRRRIHGTVAGRVQGVGFRWATRDRAVELGLVGWVRNLPDGRVELAAEGTADGVEAFAGWLAHGPAGARVDAVELHPGEATGERGFRILD